MYPALGEPDGLQNAVVDTPIYDRVLLRSLRRWTGLDDCGISTSELDDGNGLFYNSGASLGYPQGFEHGV